MENAKWKRLVRLAYILFTTLDVLILPCVYITVIRIMKYFGIIAISPWTRGFLGTVLPIVFLRILLIPYFLPVALDAVLLIHHFKHDRTAKNAIMIALLNFICTMGLFSMETVFKATMSVKNDLV